MNTELQQSQDLVSERWARTHHLHAALGELLENEGYLIPAKRLLCGSGFDSYIYRSFSFNGESDSGEEIDVLIRALESPRDNNIIIDVSFRGGRNKHLLLSPRQLFDYQPPTIEDLDLLDCINRQI